MCIRDRSIKARLAKLESKTPTVPPATVWDLSGLTDDELMTLRGATVDGDRMVAEMLVNQVVADGRLIVPIVRIRPGDLAALLP